MRPTTGRIWDFNPSETCAARRTRKRRGQDNLYLALFFLFLYSSVHLTHLSNLFRKPIVKLGGAQAVAALAYGTESVPKVDKIVGPGNIFVATAKQLCYAQGLIDVDMVAGPSEIMVIADEKSNPTHVAADLLSQAEHDKLASAWLATTSEKLAFAVQAEVERQLSLLPREEIARTSIEENGRIIIVDSLETAAKVADEIAPEHLEVCVDDPFGLLPLLNHAGSIFLGRNCPEPLGDYLAGPNHTLPTSGTARYSSPLGVDDFCRRSSYIYYTREALQDVAEDVMRFAEREGLGAHANAVRVRVKE
ncbi:MAG: histidinol dehydrogenase [Clostridia bacterium]|nr:histidinol dehydrogenase [Clostridia bacterium]